MPNMANSDALRRSSEMVFPISTSLDNTHDPNNLYGTYPRKQWQPTTPLSQPPRCQYHSTLPTKRFDSKPNGEVKGILRNKYAYSAVTTSGACAKFDDDVYDTHNDTLNSADLIPSTSAVAKCGTVLNLFVRPCAAEFLSVIFCVVVATLVEASILKTKSPSPADFAIVAAAEALAYFVSISTFSSCCLHINPAITLGSLFAGGCSPIICIAFWLVQAASATLGVFMYQLVSMQEMPILPELNSSESSAWLTVVYRLVLCQTLTSFMLVLCHLMVFVDKTPVDRNPILSDSIPSTGVISVTSAVALVSYASLLNSRSSWNPVRSLGICIAGTLQGVDVISWHYHYVFWLGPLIGSLFASFFYRLLFATGEHRLSTCQQESTV